MYVYLQNNDQHRRSYTFEIREYYTTEHNKNKQFHMLIVCISRVHGTNLEVRLNA